MTTIDDPEHSQDSERPLALDLRRRRAAHGRMPMTQRELAALSGVSLRQLSRLESCRELPSAIAAFHRLALALEVPMETLIMLRARDEQRRHVEGNRARLAANRKTRSP